MLFLYVIGLRIECITKNLQESNMIMDIKGLVHREPAQGSPPFLNVPAGIAMVVRFSLITKHNLMHSYFQGNLGNNPVSILRAQ